jgi:hypothetical protein
MADDMFNDLYEYLHTEELRSAFKRAQMSYLVFIHAAAQWRAHGGSDEWGASPPPADLVRAAVDKERERGTDEDVLADLEWVLQRWRENMVAKIKEERARKKKSDLT